MVELAWRKGRRCPLLRLGRCLRTRPELHRQASPPLSAHPRRQVGVYSIGWFGLRPSRVPYARHFSLNQLAVLKALYKNQYLLECSGRATISACCWTVKGFRQQLPRQTPASGTRHVYRRMSSPATFIPAQPCTDTNLCNAIPVPGTESTQHAARSAWYTTEMMWKSW
jgi:hypothetical protein